MRHKSHAIAALVVFVLLLIFTILSFTTFKNAIAQGIITSTLGVAIIILLYKQYDWIWTPLQLQPIDVLRRLTKWNMFDLLKARDNTNHDHNLLLNLKLIKQHPFDANNCNERLLCEYRKGTSNTGISPSTPDDTNLIAVMKTAKPYNIYKVDPHNLEQIINDVYNAKYLPMLMGAKEILYIKSVYVLIDFIKNYNPLRDHYPTLQLNEAELALISKLQQRARDPYASMFPLDTANLSGLTLLKLHHRMDLVNAVLKTGDNQFYNRLHGVIYVFNTVHDCLEAALPSFMYAPEWYEFEPNHEVAITNTPQEVKEYVEIRPLEQDASTRYITGKGFDDPEIIESSPKRAINAIIYLGKNIHYERPLLDIMNQLKIDLYEKINIDGVSVNLYFNKYLNKRIAQILQQIQQ